MKAIKLLLACFLVAGAATLAFGGPGPDYLLRTKHTEKDRAQARAQPVVPATAPVQVAACGACGCAAMKKS